MLIHQFVVFLHTHTQASQCSLRGQGRCACIHGATGCPRVWCYVPRSRWQPGLQATHLQLIKVGLELVFLFVAFVDKVEDGDEFRHCLWLMIEFGVRMADFIEKLLLFDDGKLRQQHLNLFQT